MGQRRIDSLGFKETTAKEMGQRRIDSLGFKETTAKEMGQRRIDAGDGFPFYLFLRFTYSPAFFENMPRFAITKTVKKRFL